MASFNQTVKLKGEFYSDLVTAVRKLSTGLTYDEINKFAGEMALDYGDTVFYEIKKDLGGSGRPETITFKNDCFVGMLKGNSIVPMKGKKDLKPVLKSDGYGDYVIDHYDNFDDSNASVQIDYFQPKDKSISFPLRYEPTYVVGVRHAYGSGFSYYIYCMETWQTKWFTLFSNVSSVNSFKPFQPVNNSLGATIYLMWVEVNYDSTTSGYEPEINEQTTLSSFDTEYYKPFNMTLPELGQGTVEGGGSNIYAQRVGDYTIQAGKFDKIDYYLEPTGSSYKVYVGMNVKQDFAKAFRLSATKSNEYNSVKTVVQKELDVKGLQKTKYANEENIVVSYKYLDKITKYDTKQKPIGLKGGSETFEYVTTYSSWHYEDKLNLSKLVVADDSYKLKYKDNTYIYFSDLEFNDVAYATTNLDKEPDADGNIILTDDISTFTITNHYSLKYFGDINFTYNANVSGAGEYYATSGKIVGAKNNFNSNEILELGQTATIDLYNINEKLVEQITHPFIGASKVSELPKGYGEIVSKDLLIDNVQPLYFKIKNRFSVKWEITTNYFDNFQISVPAKYKYYFMGDTFDFKEEEVREAITAKLVKHTNYPEVGKTELVNAVKSKIKFNYGNIYVETGKQEFPVEVSYIDDFDTLHKSTYRIEVTKIEPKTLLIDETSANEETISYWDNNNDTFKKPLGLEFAIKNTDDSVKIVSQDYADTNFEYYRNSNCEGNQLIIGETKLKVGEGNRIWVKDRLTKVVGSYQITWKEDTLNIVRLKNSQPQITFPLGNKFSKIKNQLLIEAIYLSGVTYNITENEFEFVKNDLVLEPTDIEIIYRNNTYNLGQTKITYTNPDVDKVEFLLNGFITTYTNQVDVINCSPINLRVTYKDSEFIQLLSYTNDETTILKTLFSVSCSKALNVSSQFQFDGSTKIDTDMGENSQIDVELDFTFNKQFSEEKHTAKYSISILEILDITGISLKNIKNEYIVGETFLNDADNTLVTIFFNDKAGKQKKLDVKLNSNFSALNILPAKGTKLDRINNSLKVQITSATNYEVRADYNVRVIPKYQSNDTKVHSILAVFYNDVYKTPNGSLINNKYLLVDEYYTDSSGNTQETTTIDEYGNLVLKPEIVLHGEKPNVEVYGYLEDVNKEQLNAKVILFKDYIPPIDGTNNIEVTYPCYVEGNADKINKCHLGTLFGSNNSRNRLFLAGNKEKPNVDWHSAAIKENSFGYIEDTSYCTYGETDSGITGYAKVADNKLLVLKSKSDKDSTVWFRVPTMVTALTGSGEAVTGFDGKALHEEEFSLIKGNNSVAGVSPHSILNFNGDTLFLSEEKNIVGLDLVGIIGDNQRYANTRSYFIDWELKQIANEHTWLWSNNKYLFVVLDKKIYVSHFETVNSGSKQYEWLPINIEDVQAIIELDNELYFGNSKGQLYKINNIYDDVSKIFLDDNESQLVTQEEDDNRVIVPLNIIEQLDSNKKYTFKTIPVNDDPTSYMYYKIARISNNKINDVDLFVDVETNTLRLCGYVNGEVDFDRIAIVGQEINENSFVYLNYIEGNKERTVIDPDTGVVTTIGGIESKAGGDPLKKYYVKYHIKRDVDDDMFDGFSAYKLYNELGEEMDVSNLISANLCRRLDGDYLVGNIHKEGYVDLLGRAKQHSYFNLYKNERIIDLVQYADQPMQRTFKAEIKHFKPVECFYITKPYTMGSLDYFKTIWQSTLTNDTNIPSEIELTYVNNKIPFERMKTISKISVESLSLNFSDLDFSKLDLMKTNVPRTYTITGVQANLKSITFGFRNYNNTNSVLCSMSIVYSVPMQSYSGD